MMERQELPIDSREEYAYLPAEREDKTIETGRPKYLPIDSCQAYGIGCNNKTNYLKTRWQKRSLFTSEVTKNNMKQIDNSPGGFLTEIVETVAKPIYNWIMTPYLQLDNATYLQLDSSTHLQLDDTTYLQQNSAAPSKSGTANEW